MINCDVFWWAIECWFVRNLTGTEQISLGVIALSLATSYRLWVAPRVAVWV